MRTIGRATASAVLAAGVLAGLAPAAAAQDDEAWPPLHEEGYYRLHEGALSPGGDVAVDDASAGLMLAGMGWLPLALDADVDRARTFPGATLALHAFIGRPRPGIRFFVGGMLGGGAGNFDIDDGSGTLVDHESTFIKSGGFAGAELWGDSPTDPYVLAIGGLFIEDRDSRTIPPGGPTTREHDVLISGMLEVRIGCMYRNGPFYLDAYLGFAVMPQNELFAATFSIGLGVGLAL